MDLFRLLRGVCLFACNKETMSVLIISIFEDTSRYVVEPSTARGDKPACWLNAAPHLPCWATTCNQPSLYIARRAASKIVEGGWSRLQCLQDAASLAEVAQPYYCIYSQRLRS